MKISEEEFRALLDRYVNNTASAEEREMLDRFFKSYQPGFPHEDLQDDPGIREEIFRGINTRIGESTQGGANRFLRLWLPLAAVISLFVLAYFFIGRVNIPGEGSAAITVVEAYAPRGQKSVRQLPDGTIVHLNSDSKISYAEGFGNGIREVNLSGEAYFEVVKDAKPFVVRAGSIRTEVLGTSFNVKNRLGNPVQVTLAEGSVNVKTASGETSVLRPNQQAVVDDSGNIETKEVNIMAFTSWKDNILFFERTSLKEAISTLESWYAVKIDIASPGLDQCLITAKYQDEPLGNVLSSFQFLLNLNITRQSEVHYTITGTGCK